MGYEEQSKSRTRTDREVLPCNVCSLFSTNSVPQDHAIILGMIQHPMLPRSLMALRCQLTVLCHCMVIKCSGLAARTLDC